MQDRIRRFAPRRAAPGWERVADRVRELVLRAEPQVPYVAGELMSAVSRLACFCHSYGLEQQRDWLASPTVEWFLEVGCRDVTSGTRATYRSRLKSVREAVYGPDNGVGKPIKISANDSARPYSPAEQAALWSCATGQPTPTLRRGLRTLLVLGFGCGLASPKVRRLLPGHIRLCGEAGVVVHTPPPHERLVVCRRRWEPPLRELAEETSATGYLFLPTAHSRHKNLVANFLGRLHRSSTTPPISTERMRATWIAELLTERVPLPVIVAAAGLDGLGSLDRLLPYLPVATPFEAEQWLRGQP